MVDDVIQNSDLACSICHETFRRVEHLKRHALTHDDAKPHACQFCGAQYKRSDALRRHWKTCTARIAAGVGIPKRSLSGKRKQACDSCTARKRACSTALPCSECAMRKTECTYHQSRPSIYNRQSLHLAKEVVIEGNAAVSGTHSVSSPVPSRETAVHDRIPSPGLQHPRFGFLANFTKAGGLNEAYSFNSGLMNTRPTPSLLGTSDTGPLGDRDYLQGIAASNPFDCYFDDFEPGLWADANTSRNHVEEGLLAEKARQMWDSLRPILDSPTTHHLNITSSEWFEFFSENATRYLHLFWSRWYHHCPIVHSATFNLNTCSPLLLMTMCLIGACMSSLDADHQSAKRFLDVIEELIFSNPLFMESPRLGSTDENLLQTRDNVQILQAMCFMCLLQKWEGSIQAKLRMQRHRFTAFVATTRAMGLSQARHPRIDPNSTLSVEAWKEYTLKAEMIRTFNHVFLLDSAFVIFHNSVPRMVLQEMTIDLTCPEDVFQAASPAEFIEALKLHPLCTVPLLTDCVRNLCAESPDPGVVAHLSRESALNLFTIATAVHGLIFHQLRAFSPLPLATDPLRRALGRWEKAWEVSMDKTTNLTMEDGVLPFPLHAREFAALARVHIEKSHLTPEEWNLMIRQLPEH
ncbi:Zn(II)2Cys6 transcription factor [Aspergillus mulundensis]|uniref:Putative transcription factor with C2H2 and Zn(2)-Cys(6) DNA binding n=1 Tax=Aspergillus mulundensis TaxID=1810919 RepID=A0A3D8QVQ0_9EURO|nr:putative transcription factor with C2H2 and Zn(2)-Cys(6) DNA binding [Aspergillus mulundensis]RDW65771.1 putative transcription factor with C2H2 and Zn(2)-Cys(6) DNA binding [Aspergillus mulundensis]